jgi:MFS family permease
VIERSPVYYGWVILAAGTLGMSMTTPGQTLGVAVFIDPILADLALERSAVSALYLGGTLIGALTLPLVGRLVDRHGPRAVGATVAALFALACVFMGTVWNAGSLAIGFTLIRGLGQGALGLVSVQVINLWFVRRRGLAIGLAGLGYAGLNAVFPLFIAMLIEAFGWRTAYPLLGGLVALTILPVAAVFFRERPEAFGLVPDGRLTPGAASRIAEAAFTPAQARRTAMHWQLVAGAMTVSMLGTGLVFHHFAIMGANGLDRVAAAGVFVPLALVTAVTNLGAGWLLDRVRPVRVQSVMSGLLAVALIAATLVRDVPGALAYGAIFGVMQGLQFAVSATAFAHYFGRAHLGAIRGVVSTLGVGASALGPVVVAAGPELLGAFAPGLRFLAILPVALAVSGLFVHEPRRPGPEAGP